jgi:hypothetical protein
MGQKFLPIYLIVIVKLEKQKQFDEIYEYCQLIFDKKLKHLTKINLYCQTKDIIPHSAVFFENQQFSLLILWTDLISLNYLQIVVKSD